MNGLGGTADLDLSGAAIITPHKFEFTELQFRQVLAQVQKACAANGGQLPITNPIEVLALGIVMDKLNEVAERLLMIERRLGPEIHSFNRNLLVPQPGNAAQ